MSLPYIQTFVGLANFAAAEAANLAAAQVDNPGVSLQPSENSSCVLGADGVTYTLVSNFVPAWIPGS